MGLRRRAQGGDAVKLVWDASEPKRETDAALYETRRLATRRFWKLLMGFGSMVLWIVGAVLVMISCALAVYLGAILVAGMVL